jgi:hypothetical protein
MRRSLGIMSGAFALRRRAFALKNEFQPSVVPAKGQLSWPAKNDTDVLFGNTLLRCTETRNHVWICHVSEMSNLWLLMSIRIFYISLNGLKRYGN